jgi:hypothetical protein
MKNTKSKKEVTLKEIENLINKTEYFRITSNDSTTKTAIGNVGNRSLRITIVYYLNSVVFTDLIDNRNQLIYTLIK